MFTSRSSVLIITAVALLACYAATLRGMAAQWWTDEDMSHGFVVPIVIAWILWRERGRWRAIPLKPSLWGLGLLGVAAALQFASELGAGLFAGSLAFLLSVTGAVVCLGGLALLRAWVFPLLLAVFMLPKLAVVYNQVTLPLQLLASRMAAAILTTAGLGVIRQGNILDVRGHQIAVAEACSGIRYLLPLGFMALVFGYIWDSKPWMRVALLITAIPVAIVANAVRVAASGWLPALAEGTLHQASGWIIFVVCLGTLALARRLFQAVSHRHV